jgi:hypothetical protein
MKEVKNFSRKKIKKIKNLLEYSDQHNDKKMLKRFIVACKILFVQQVLTTALTKHSIFSSFLHSPTLLVLHKCCRKQVLQNLCSEENFSNSLFADKTNLK